MSNIPSKEVVICAECGISNRPDRNVCRACGKPLNGPLAIETQQLASNEEVQPAQLAERIYDMACATASAWNGGEEIPYELKQALNQWIVDAKKPNWIERHAPETPVLRDVGDAVECDVRITIASDTAVKVEECFKAVDAALDTVLDHHDVAMTMKCETRAAQKAFEQANTSALLPSNMEKTP